MYAKEESELVDELQHTPCPFPKKASKIVCFSRSRTTLPFSASVILSLWVFTSSSELELCVVAEVKHLG